MQREQTSVRPQEGSPFARHIPALDGVRGLAILGVVASHLFPGTPHSGLERQVQALFNFGASGVDLFFVLSGFLITGILYDSLPDPAFFRKFYARRALRIFPLYYGVLGVLGVAAVVFRLHFHRELLSLALYLQNTWLIAEPITTYTGPTGLPLSHFWSLAIEEQFYLVWPLCVFLLRRRKALLACCGASILLCPLLRDWAYVHGASFGAVHVNTLFRADSLLAGGGLALLLRTRFHDRVLGAGVWVFAGGAAGVAVLRQLAGTVSLAETRLAIVALNYTALAAASVGIVALALGSPAVAGLFRVRVLRQLGKYSYGIYVLHLILFGYLEAAVRSAILAHVTENRAVVTGISGLVLLALSFGCAYLSYHLYERRFLHLKRYFDYRRHGDTVGPGTPGRPAI